MNYQNKRPRKTTIIFHIIHQIKFSRVPLRIEQLQIDMIRNMEKNFCIRLVSFPPG